jgi:hypothetical protein
MVISLLPPIVTYTITKYHSIELGENLKNIEGEKKIIKKNNS